MGIINMGTVPLMASLDIQSLGVKAIFGGFVFILVVIAVFNLFKTNIQLRNISFVLVVGVVIICSLILLAVAVDALINIYGIIL